VWLLPGSRSWFDDLDKESIVTTVTRYWVTILAAGVGGAFWATGALAQGAPPTPVAPRLDSGDTAWVLASSALVLAMIMPGLALFYGGLVRTKNALGTIMHSVVILCLVSLI